MTEIPSATPVGTLYDQEKARQAQAELDKKKAAGLVPPEYVPWPSPWLPINELINAYGTQKVEIQERPVAASGDRFLTWVRASMPTGRDRVAANPLWLTTLVFIDCPNMKESLITGLPAGTTQLRRDTLEIQEKGFKGPHSAEGMLAVEKSLLRTGRLHDIEAGTVQHAAAQYLCR